VRYASAWLFGAICPSRGVGAALVLPEANTDAMNRHLAEISQAVAPGAHGLIVMDQARWHTTGALVLPDNLSLLHLPPVSPELNPVENVWEFLRSNRLPFQLYETLDDIIDSCCEAWNWLTEQPQCISSIGARGWARVGL